MIKIIKKSNKSEILTHILPKFNKHIIYINNIKVYSLWTIDLRGYLSLLRVRRNVIQFLPSFFVLSQVILNSNQKAAYSESEQAANTNLY